MRRDHFDVLSDMLDLLTVLGIESASSDNIWDQHMRPYIERYLSAT